MAAENGHSDAQCDLGFLFFTGKEGFAKDLPQAIEWFKKAAMNGNVRAIGPVAWEYKKNNLGIPNFVESLAWFDLGYQLSPSDSTNPTIDRSAFKNAYDQLAGTLTTEEIEAAKKRTNELIAQIKGAEKK